MKHISPSGYLFITLVLEIIIMNFHYVNCKTVQRDSHQQHSAVEKEQRKLDNFVEFTEDGDQLAVESVGTFSVAEESKGGLLKTHAHETGRQCPNVQKAVYPVIPVIIASLVGLIGAIIISAIVRLVFSGKNDSNESSEYGGYDRRIGNRNRNTGFLGLDFPNFSRLAKTVLSAIEKVY